MGAQQMENATTCGREKSKTICCVCGGTDDVQKLRKQRKFGIWCSCFGFSTRKSEPDQGWPTDSGHKKVHLILINIHGNYLTFKTTFDVRSLLHPWLEPESFSSISNWTGVKQILNFITKYLTSDFFLLNAQLYDSINNISGIPLQTISQHTAIICRSRNSAINFYEQHFVWGVSDVTT